MSLCLEEYFLDKKLCRGRRDYARAGILAADSKKGTKERFFALDGMRLPALGTTVCRHRGFNWQLN